MTETSGMSDEEIQEQLEALQRERQRRDEAVAREEEKAALADQINALLFQYRMLCVDGEDNRWAQPVSAVDAYPMGAVVSHEGDEWESLVTANVWEPGVSGWRVVPVVDGEGGSTVPEWVQPAGGHDAYQKGEQVTFEGVAYESTVDNNVWSPANYPQGWQEVEESND